MSWNETELVHTAQTLAHRLVGLDTLFAEASAVMDPMLMSNAHSCTSREYPTALRARVERLYAVERQDTVLFLISCTPPLLHRRRKCV